MERWRGGTCERLEEPGGGCQDSSPSFGARITKPLNQENIFRPSSPTNQERYPLLEFVKKPDADIPFYTI